MILLLLAAQVSAPAQAAAPVKASSAPAERSWSILQPVAGEPCTARVGGKPDDIVVCGQPEPLPYPELPSDPPRAVNPDRSGTGALAAVATPCAARSGGCQTGVDLFGAGTAVVRLIQKVVAPSSCCEAPGEATNVVGLGGDVVHGVKGAFRKKPNRSQRVPIPLDDAPVSTAGKITP